MKLTSALRSSSSGRLKFLFMVWAVLPVVVQMWTGHAAEPAPSATNEVVIPKSLFVTTDPRGKDPFFPHRPRFGSPVVLTNIVTATGPNLSDLQLRGITGPPDRRIALINNQTFAKDEENDVRIGGGKIKIKVTDIRDKSVVIVVDGQTESRELVIPERLLRVGEQ